MDQSFLRVKRVVLNVVSPNPSEKAAVLTAHAQGKRAHHIADYLPKTELERFEAQVGAAKSGSAEPEFEDYADKKLNESNKGFEMLMKQGWKVGSGLGKEGAGVVAPVNKYAAFLLFCS